VRRAGTIARTARAAIASIPPSTMHGCTCANAARIRTTMPIAGTAGAASRCAADYTPPAECPAARLRRARDVWAPEAWVAPRTDGQKCKFQWVFNEGQRTSRHFTGFHRGRGVLWYFLTACSPSVIQPDLLGAAAEMHRPRPVAAGTRAMGERGHPHPRHCADPPDLSATDDAFAMAGSSAGQPTLTEGLGSSQRLT
jgi:hypothetical protein